MRIVIAQPRGCHLIIRVRGESAWFLCFPSSAISYAGNVQPVSDPCSGPHPSQPFLILGEALQLSIVYITVTSGGSCILSRRFYPKLKEGEFYCPQHNPRV